jgi:hypothetical protein
MPPSPAFEITYHLRTGNAGQQRAVVQATSPDTARRLFIQQNPGCVLDSTKPLPSRP